MVDDTFDPTWIIATLDRHGVAYILVGGYAAQLHGARRATYDIDIAPSTTADNLERLAAALKSLKARIRVDNVPDGLAFSCSAESLRGIQMLNLQTCAGDLDLTFTPAGFPQGFTELERDAESYSIAGVTISVAALEDVIKSKEAAARPKDLDALPELIRIARKRSR